MDAEELRDLVSAEMNEVDEIIGRPCEIHFTVEGRLALTGFRVTAQIYAKSTVNDLRTIVSTFYLSQFPGQCGILISHETYQPFTYQKKGLSVPIQKMKSKIAKNLKYTILMASTVPKNGNDKVMERSGFSKVTPLYFQNRRTGNQITTWMKTL